MNNNLQEPINPSWLRAHGKEVVDWAADYLEHPERYPVLSRIKPGDIKKALPPNPPQHPEPFEHVLKDFQEIIMPGITHWNHPGFMGFFGITGSPPGILGELISAVLNVNGMLWRTSPAVTELEEVALDWLRIMLAMPAEFKGFITDTASVSTFIALVAARDAANPNIRREGLTGNNTQLPLRLYCSDQAHSSVEKAAIAIGVGQNGVRKIAVDEAFRMDPAKLAEAITEDRKSGWSPFAVVATVGTTSTTSIDPIEAIAAICKREQLWLHVDGAYGGSAGIVPEYRWILNGVEQADSFVINPHKWLFTPIDCSVLYTRRWDILRRAFSLIPDYLTTTEQDVTNLMDYGIQLGRRFRALKLWFVIRSYGIEGMQSFIREHCRLANIFAKQVDASDRFERMAPVPLSVVNFRLHPSRINDENELESLNAKLLGAVNASGEVFLTHTKLHGKYVLHLAIGNIGTSEKHVQRAWDLLNQYADIFFQHH
jgi:aromatic-L-amino-acid decarboxylase